MENVKNLCQVKNRKFPLPFFLGDLSFRFPVGFFSVPALFEAKVPLKKNSNKISNKIPQAGMALVLVPENIMGTSWEHEDGLIWTGLLPEIVRPSDPDIDDMYNV